MGLDAGEKQQEKKFKPGGKHEGKKGETGATSQNIEGKE